MSQDGRLQTIEHKIPNDRPIRNEIRCDCGGLYYAAAGSRYVRCSGGEVRCTHCGREARRFGKRFTCGFGCRA